VDDARRIVAGYMEHYNHVRLHCAIGYVAPSDKLKGRDKEIFTERDRKLEQAREQRRERFRLSVLKTRDKWVVNMTYLIPPSETETGSAGKQPVEG
jgi:hypothetical protein